MIRLPLCPEIIKLSKSMHEKDVEKIYEVPPGRRKSPKYTRKIPRTLSVRSRSRSPDPSANRAEATGPGGDEEHWRIGWKRGGIREEGEEISRRVLGRDETNVTIAVGQRIFDNKWYAGQRYVRRLFFFLVSEYFIINKKTYTEVRFLAKLYSIFPSNLLISAALKGKVDR